MELDLEFYALGTVNGQRNSVGSKSPGGQNSPGSGRASMGGNSAINGTQRNKTLTINQIKSA